MSSAKWQPFCLSLNVLNQDILPNFIVKERRVQYFLFKNATKLKVTKNILKKYTKHGIILFWLHF